MARVLGIIRLSRETDESTSPVRQREAIDRWAELHGHAVIGYAEDLDVSGAVDPFERPELGAWLNERPQSFDIACAAKVDRISRKLLHFAQLLSWAADNGKAVATVTDSIDTATPTGRLIANILAMFAEFERDMIKERNAEGAEKLRKVGRWKGGMIPYTHKPVKNLNGEGVVLVPDPETSAIIADACRRIEKGHSANSVVIDLNKQGIPSPRDRQDAMAGRKPGRKTKGKETSKRYWSNLSLLKIIRSPMTVGITVLGGEIVRGDDGMPLMFSEPAIPRDLWERANEVIRAKPRRRTTKVSPLLDVAYCAQCGGKLYTQVKNDRKGNRVERYRCGVRYLDGTSCKAKSILAADLEGAVEDSFLHAVGDAEILERVWIPGEDYAAELKELESAWDYLMGKAETASPAMRGRYETRIADVEARISHVQSLPVREAGYEYRPTGATYREEWRQLDNAGKRELLVRSGVHAMASNNDGVFFCKLYIPEDLKERLQK